MSASDWTSKWEVAPRGSPAGADGHSSWKPTTVSRRSKIGWRATTTGAPVSAVRGARATELCGDIWLLSDATAEKMSRPLHRLPSRGAACPRNPRRGVRRSGCPRRFLGSGAAPRALARTVSCRNARRSLRWRNSRPNGSSPRPRRSPTRTATGRTSPARNRRPRPRPRPSPSSPRRRRPAPRRRQQATRPRSRCSPCSACPRSAPASARPSRPRSTGATRSW